MSKSSEYLRRNHEFGSLSFFFSSSFKYLLVVGEVAPPGTLAAGAREGDWDPFEASLGSPSKC